MISRSEILSLLSYVIVFVLTSCAFLAIQRSNLKTSYRSNQCAPISSYVGVEDKKYLLSLNGEVVLKNIGTEKLVSPYVKDEEFHDLYVDENGTFWSGASSGKIFMSEPGGGTWKEILTGTNTSERLFTISGKASQILAAGAYGLILLSEDLGRTWKSLQNSNTLHLYDSITLGNNIYIAGESGSFFQYSLSSKSLSPINAATSSSIFGLTQVSPHEILAYGTMGYVSVYNTQQQLWKEVKHSSDTSVFQKHYMSKDGRLILVDHTKELFRLDTTSFSLRKLKDIEMADSYMPLVQSIFNAECK